MNILIKYKNGDLDYNLRDFEKDSQNSFFLAKNHEKAITILNENIIDKAILEIDALDEINLLDYINNYFPDIPVVIIADRKNENILSTIKRGIFAIMEKPFNLKQILAEL